ncbi:ANTAR domain-containing protein [Streptomyces cyaneofuscatus]|uniref:ANTAR domain-containing protein n=1 Tax=Streptomyces cyaneofuscatus TaxID=66883 RepID=UPI0036BCD674
MQTPLGSGQEHEQAATIPRDPLLAEQEILFLRRAVDGLRAALRSRPMVDMAIGMVVATEGCSRDAAWLILVNSSQRTNTKLRSLAFRLTHNSARSLSFDLLHAAPGKSARGDTTVEDPASSHFSSPAPVDAAGDSGHSISEGAMPLPSGP